MRVGVQDQVSLTHLPCKVRCKAPCLVPVSLSNKVSALSVIYLERRHQASWCLIWGCLQYNSAIFPLPIASVLAAEQQPYIFLGGWEMQKKQLLMQRPSSCPASSGKLSLENSGLRFSSAFLVHQDTVPLQPAGILCCCFAHFTGPRPGAE